MMMSTPYDLKPSKVQIMRRMSMETFMVRVFTGPLSSDKESVSIEADKGATSDDVVAEVCRKLRLGGPTVYSQFQLAEVLSSGGQLCKERRLDPTESPVALQLLWPKMEALEVESGYGGSSSRNSTVGSSTISSTKSSSSNSSSNYNSGTLSDCYRFYLRRKDHELPVGGWLIREQSVVDSFLLAFLTQPTDGKEFPDLCSLPDLNERTLLQNLRARFEQKNIYTYVGSILIAVNPFKFFPIYNPKYVSMYQNKHLGDLPPHIFAVADAAYHKMLKNKKNQCIVISGESGSGKTESTNLLLHHLTALSQKGLHGSGVEQTILGAGPVLEAFGNAKTVHNNNSSRFGKFIQVNYKQNGMVHGAIVEQYLLEKSRIVFQAKYERNYHVFYYLLAGANDQEREALHLSKADQYYYLSQSACYSVDGVDEKHEFTRLKQSMEMVGFSPETQNKIFSVLSAVLLLGNIEFKKKGDQHHDESVCIKNEETVRTICSLLKVKDKHGIEAMTQKRTTAGDETFVITYKMEDAIATRDAMAKCIYGALFDWIVLKVNQALLAKKHDSDHEGNSIGVLDIFGFEDFGRNSFEQFCINYANEHLQYYFNQHIFKFEQEEYRREGIQWKNIEFIDNTGSLELFSKRPSGLFYLLDEECSFPAATNETLLNKFTHHHKNNNHYDVPQLREGAFSISHYAGKVKYFIKDFREKNVDMVRPEIVATLKKSSLTFVRELMGIDPVAVLRWSVVRAFFRCFFAFIGAGKRYRANGGKDTRKRMSRKVSDTSMQEDKLLNLTTTTTTLTKEGLQRTHTTLQILPEPSHPHPQLGEDESSSSSSTKQRQQRMELHQELLIYSSFESELPENDALIIRRARKLLMKNKSFKPKQRPCLSFRDIKALKAITSRSTSSAQRGVGSKKQPPTVGTQFQWSLSRLMTTLNQANPFFIRCIKSNKEKAACKFDEELVMRQLRYTGMLATVKIRQSGYNYRLQFQEFIQLYKILLPRKRNHTKADIVHFLALMGLNADNYQIGINKVFLRESEKMHLDSTLHTAIMERVITIQRWVKSILERQGFLRLREAAVVLQKYFRRYVAMRDYQNFQLIQLQNSAASLLQNHIRCYLCRRGFLARRDAAVYIQSYVRTVLTRRKFVNLRDEYYATLAKKEAERKEAERLELERIEQEEREEKERLERERIEALEREEAEKIQRELEKAEQAQLRNNNQISREKKEELQSTASDEGVLMKAGSNEELEEAEEEENARRPLSRRDSEESSGILDDSESEMPIPGTPDTYDSVTEPDRCAEPLPSTDTPSPLFTRVKSHEHKEEEEQQRQRRASKVQEIAEIFQRTPEKDDSDGRIIVIGRGSKRWKHKKSAAPLAQQESFGDEMELSSPDRPPSRLDPKKRPQPIVIPRTGTPLTDESRRQIESAVSRQSDLVNNKKKEDAVVASVIDNHAGTSQQQAHANEQDKAGSGHLSPFHRAKWHITHWVGETKMGSMRRSLRFLGRQSSTKGKKDDSDEESEESSSTATMSPQRHPGDMKGLIGGVSVLPTIPVPSLPSMPHHQPNEMTHMKGSPMFAVDANKILPWRERSRKAPKKPKRQPKRGPSPQSRSNMKLTRSTEWQYPENLIIDDIRELGYLDEFIAQKENQLYKEPSGTQHTFDRIFRRALETFRTDLKSIIALEAPKETPMIRYRDLFEKFRQIMEVEMKHEPAAPLMLAVNAFRGFLDEFRKQQESRKKDSNKRAEEKARVEKKNKRDKNKNKNQEAILNHKGHSFEQVLFSIRTCCEVCSAFIGMTDKGYVCQVCKLACHRKCYIKLNASCKAVSARTQPNNQMFGAPLKSLVSESQKIPVICDRLMSAIEAIGLYTEGIYRKSGAAPKIKELKAQFEDDPPTAHLEDYHVHVLTSLLKLYLRSLPEPLLTFDLYEDFLRCLDIEDEKEMIKSLFEVIKKLPKPNFDLFERLVFHLSNVIMHSGANKMSASALSVIFAPVLLRSGDNIQAQEAMLRLPLQMKCIECLLNDRVATLNSKLKDISTLESAERTTGERLHAVRASRRTTKRSPVSSPVKQVSLTRQGAVEEEDDSISDVVEADGEERELEAQEQALSRHLASIHKEKDKLTYKLPMLDTRQASSDEDVLSGDELETGSDIYSISGDDVDFNNLPSLPPLLHHVTKGRSSGPTQRRPPGRYQQQHHQKQHHQQPQPDHHHHHHHHTHTHGQPSGYIINNNDRNGRQVANLQNVVEDDSEASFPDPNSSITIRPSHTTHPHPTSHPHDPSNPHAPCIKNPFVPQSSFVSVPDILHIGDEDEIMV